MQKLLMNPFQFGGPVEGEYFLPRPELAKTLLQEEGTSRGSVAFDDPLFAIWLKLSS